MTKAEQNKLREVLDALDRLTWEDGTTDVDVLNAIQIVRSMLEQKPSYPDTLDEMSTLKKPTTDEITNFYGVCP